MADVKAREAPVPQTAIDFLAKKIKVETEKWDDLKWGEHAHAFTVAHSTGAGVLDDIFKSMNKAVAEGESFQTFRQRMLDTMKEKGWYGGAGHTEDEKRYVNWRIGVIYDTNMRTAYAQADYREQLAGAELRPVWVYQSQLTGDNRRQEHIALHGKAFRYDDRFWDTCYPPNGWGCECYVNTESEHGAEKAGIKAGDSRGLELPEIDETWAYNAGREALAPNFSKYQNLPKDALKQIYEKYHRGMNNTRLSEGGFKTLIKRTNESDYKPLNINYQVGTLEAERYEAMRKEGVQDCKVMATDHDLWHGTGYKNAKQKIPEKLFGELYTAFQEPEHIYREKIPLKSTQEQIFHLVKDTGDGRKIKIIVHVRTLGNGQTSMQVRTMGHIEHDYAGGNYEKIW
jgi:uncharacterized protein with gpF-like domain